MVLVLSLVRMIDGISERIKIWLVILAIGSI
jgi:hypothetical protein